MREYKINRLAAHEFSLPQVNGQRAERPDASRPPRDVVGGWGVLAESLTKCSGLVPGVSLAAMVRHVLHVPRVLRGRGTIGLWILVAYLMVLYVALRRGDRGSGLRITD